MTTSDDPTNHAINHATDDATDDATDQATDDAIRPGDLVARLDRTPYGAVLRDRARRRREVYRALSGHPDPVLREIGGQLADGTMRPRDALRVPAYVEALRRAGERGAKRLDAPRVAEQVRQLIGRDAARSG